MGTRLAAHRTTDEVERAETAPADVATPTSDPTQTPDRVAGRRETVAGNGSTGADGATSGQVPRNRKKSKKAADAERRERHRLAEERIEAERAQRRAENRAARERDAAERAERQRVAEAAQERARREEAERIRQAAKADAAGERSGPVDNDGTGQEATRRRAQEERQSEAVRAAERERKRQAEAARRAARAERSRRQAERKAERRRVKDEERRAEREAVRARTLGTDPYATLGIELGATAEEVTRAYRRLARMLHPDLHQQGAPHERAAREAQMKRVNVAYGLLGDPQRRKAYDRLHGTVRG